MRIYLTIILLIVTTIVLGAAAKTTTSGQDGDWSTSASWDNGIPNEGKESPHKGKTYEEIMGIDKANELKIKQSKNRKGKRHSEEHKKKISDSVKRSKNKK